MKGDKRDWHRQHHTTTTRACTFALGCRLDGTRRALAQSQITTTKKTPPNNMRQWSVTVQAHNSQMKK